MADWTFAQQVRAAARLGELGAVELRQHRFAAARTLLDAALECWLDEKTFATTLQVAGFSPQQVIAELEAL